jgi:hypothetical protein
LIKINIDIGLKERINYHSKPGLSLSSEFINP